MILPRLQVLTVNTHKGFNPFNRRFILPELREAVRSVGADLVFLQEVLGSHSLHAARLPSHAGAAIRVSGRQHVAAVRLRAQRGVSRRPPWQCRALKHPILAHRNLDVSVAGNEERGLLHAVIDIGRPLHAVCVHLGLREAQRQRQLQLLCELVAGLPEREPVVVAGDFNDWRQRADQLLAGCGLREVFVGAQGRPARSFPARWPVLPLDRIYLRNARGRQPRILSRRPWSHLSDHLPLAVEVEP